MLSVHYTSGHENISSTGGGEVEIRPNFLSSIPGNEFTENINIIVTNHSDGNF